MATQIPPPFYVPDPDEKDPPREPGIPPAPEDPIEEDEKYKLPPSERPREVRDPHLPGA